MRSYGPFVLISLEEESFVASMLWKRVCSVSFIVSIALVTCGYFWNNSVSESKVVEVIEAQPWSRRREVVNERSPIQS